MNNSYLSYIKSRNPIKLLSNILRYYRKNNSQEVKDSAVKKHQSAPAMMTNKDSDLENQKKPEESLIFKNNVDIQSPSGSSSRLSSESLKFSWPKKKMIKTPSVISLNKKTSFLDLSLKDKLVQMPLRGLEKRKEISKSYSCPWQNFNLEEKHIYHKIRPVNNLSLELLKNKRSILKKQKVPKPQITKPLLKDVKFSKAAAMMIHQNVCHNVMRQARINLSTTARHTVGDNTIFRKQPNAINVPKKVSKNQHPYRHASKACDGEDKDKPTRLTKRRSGTSFAGRARITFKTLLFPKRSGGQISKLSTKSFYSQKSKDGPSKKVFKDKSAYCLYRNAMEQCEKIRKHSPTPGNSVNWNVRLASPQFIEQERKSTKKTYKQKPRPKTGAESTKSVKPKIITEKYVVHKKVKKGFPATTVRVGNKTKIVYPTKKYNTL
nr:unnamed protein product [Callosobruchus analis]